MKVVNSAQLSFAITCGLGFYSPDFQTLGDDAAVGASKHSCRRRCRLSPTFIKSGYTFSMAGVAIPGAPRRPATGSPRARRRRATPSSPIRWTSRRPARYFGTNADGTIYEDAASYLLTMPEAGAPPGGTPIK